MDKNISGPLARTARLLDLVPYLNTHQGISIEELAEKFEVTSTQITSDLTTLWMCGLPGYTPLELMDLDFDSGFVTIRNAETLSKPRHISFDEGIALLIGLDLLSSSIPEDRKDLIAHLDTLKEKISSKFGAPVIVKADPKISPTILEKISSALGSRSVVEIEYHSLYKDEVTTRSIQPIEIILESGNQYVRGYCFTAQALRDFRIDRISAIGPSTTVPVQNLQQTNPEKIEYEVAFHEPTRDVIERFGIDFDNISSASIQRSFSKQWIERSIMASGGHVELVTPQNLRSSLRSKAQLILDRYLDN
jgi:proteasome accessory factor C